MTQEKSQRTYTPVVVVAVMLVAGILAAWQIPQIELQNDLATWLSEDDEQARALRRMESYFPHKAKVLVSWDSSSLNDPRCSTFRDTLKQTEFVETVRTASDVVETMVQGKVDQAEAIQRRTGLLIGESASDVNPPVNAVLTLNERGIARPAGMIQAIESAAADSGIPSDELHVDGAIVTSHAVDQEVIASTWNTSNWLVQPPVFVLSAAGGILLGFL